MITPTPAPEPGAAGAFGKYELVRRLAQGGMAEVWLAKTLSGGGVVRTCVIKRILPAYSQDRQFVSMFIDEARILIGLGHPNVVRLYDFGRVEDSYFMALEYVSGCNLVAVLQHLFGQSLAMDQAAAVFVSREVLTGLHHAHTQVDANGQLLGVVHRDVSPHNVLVSTDGEVKVADFGIAQARNKVSRTTPGTVMGKFAYMAPEQALGEGVDARADVFAVGVMLHECISGQRLFSSTTPAETMVKLLHSTPPRLRESVAEVPGDLDEAVARALERNAADRWDSALQMADALSGVLTVLGGYDGARLQSYLSGLGVPALSGAPGPSRLTGTHHPSGGTQSLNAPAPAPLLNFPPTQALVTDARLEDLRAALRREADLWTLTALGNRHQELGQLELAVAAWRTAAAAFAWRGLLIQGLCVLDRAAALISQAAWEADVHALGEIFTGDAGALNRQVGRVDVGGYFKMLQHADPMWKSTRKRPGADRVVPLFGTVSPDVLVGLMQRARVMEYPAGQRLVIEGQSGDTLYALAHGRVVVWCNPPPGSRVDAERVYLSSLAEGDFFGEFGFLTGEPRSASVDAVLDTTVLEVDRESIQDLLNSHPRISGPLMDFYKQRVLELLMARNPVLSVLPAVQRRTLINGATPRAYPDGEMILTEGDPGDSFFFIRQGEVEVFSEKDGVPVFINKLRDGEFFGEMACIRGNARSASCRAMGDVEVLVIAREALEEVLTRQPELRTALDQAMALRSAEAEERVRSTWELLQ